MIEPLHLVSIFRKLGLRPPSRIFIFADNWVEEGFEVTYGSVDNPRERFRCTCCECYLPIGPPGHTDGPCRNCGRCG